MPDDLRVIWILAIGLSLACATGYLAQRLRLSPVIGYLIAGYIVGPNSPGFIADQMISDQLAHIGVTLLMFAVGLNFNWKDISTFKKIVIPGAMILSTLSIAAGSALSIWLGESMRAGIVIGMALCVSSTVVIVRILSDQHLLHSKQGHLVIGWTIIEDVISVLALILLPSLAAFSDSTTSGCLIYVIYTLFTVLLKILFLGLVVYFFGQKIIVNILKRIARTRSHELFTLAVLACVFLIALCSSHFFGISIALGAFIAGTIVGNTDMSHQAAANALPMRDAFAVLFFLSVGMLFNPVAIQNNIPLFLGIIVILLVLRPIVAYLILKLSNYPSYIAYTVALAISQIGEYSFILSEEGSYLKLLPDDAYDIIVAGSFLSIALNPLLFQLFKRHIHSRKGESFSPSQEISFSSLYESKSSQASFLPKAIVVGFGPVGKSAAHFLQKKYQVTVIDQNIDTVSQSKEKMLDMLFGDATQLQLLERADIGNTNLMVITTPELHVTELIIEAAQKANPYIKIIARIHFQSDYKKIKFENFPTVCDEEAASEKMISLLQNLP